MQIEDYPCTVGTERFRAPELHGNYGGFLRTCSHDAYAPVSYTHLDVYKRQAYHWEAKRMVENEQSFGEYLRQLIRDSGITQHKFYTELGIRKPYFYDCLLYTS